MKRFVILIAICFAILTSCVIKKPISVTTEQNVTDLADNGLTETITEATAAADTKAEEPTSSVWETGSYVDQFGDTTQDKYIATTIYGKFSNTATDNSDLRVDFVADKAYFKIQLYEYKSTLVKNPYSKSLYYDVQYKIGNNVTKIEGWLSTDGYMCFSPEDDFNLVKTLKYNDVVKFYIVRRDVPTTTYSFALEHNHTKFTTAYNQLPAKERTMNDAYVKAKVIEELEKLKK